MFRYLILMVITVSPGLLAINDETRTQMCLSSIDEITMASFSSHMIPSMEGKYKGQAGKICVIGGSTEYTGAPYFTAMASLKVGADLVFVITTESAAPVIKSYSPDLIVYPFLDEKYVEKIKSLISLMDVIVIGPGLGRENATMTLIYKVFQFCKDLTKPLVVDADGLYAISHNNSIIKDYPNPGVILTPNHHEAKGLMNSVAPANVIDWQKFWGKYVSMLTKGKKDIFFSHFPKFGWEISTGGSGRRAGGQGDILAGFIATFYNWALKSNLCSNNESAQLSHSIATYAAAYLTRLCNFKAYEEFGRSLTASDMLNQIHKAFLNATSQF